MMLVTDGGKIIRSPVADIRIAGRSTQGVTLFDTADDEKVVSVAHLKEGDEPEDTEDSDIAADGEAPAVEAPETDDPAVDVDDTTGDA